MTKEEAILCLKGMKNYARDTFTEQTDWQDSLDMAIRALEQENYNQTKVDALIDINNRYRDTLDLIIKALEREPKFIAKADGTIEQIKDCEDCLFKKEWEKIGKLISVVLEKQTDQEINDDYISREKTLEKFCDYVGSGMSMNDFDALYDIVAKMPSVRQKTGHWIMHIDDLFPAESTMECSECGNHQPLTIDDNYCPNCGGKMEQEILGDNL